LLLLFAVGLKLRLGQITQPQVLVGGSLMHFAITTAVFTLGPAQFTRLDWHTALLLAIALSFSSTVFSAKILEAKRDIGAFYGRTAIGILIVQDIIALVFALILPLKGALFFFLLILFRLCAGLASERVHGADRVARAVRGAYRQAPGRWCDAYLPDDASGRNGPRRSRRACDRSRRSSGRGRRGLNSSAAAQPGQEPLHNRR